MFRKNLLSISSIFLIIVFVKSQSTYKAAVVEFSPRISAYNPQDLLLENAAFYINYIENAAELGVEIIVFPEDGLTGLNIWTADATFESMVNYSTLVPEIKDEIAPCDYSSVQYYAKALIDLSCSARTNGIYTVINVLEKSLSSDNLTVLYNTDVVFDRNGVVIAKYRKVNLFYEPFLTPGNTTVTFQTDFGVTFAIFTCFDILFKNPSVDVLTDTTITDVVYPVAWFSEVPFLQALSIQAGYAKANGVNLLASGLSNATNGNGGSGIYLANGTIMETYISAVSASKMIIQDVPIWSKRLSSCDESKSVSDFADTQASYSAAGLSLFKLIAEDLSNYTTNNLNLTQNYSSTTICSEGSSFCCTFNVTINLNTTSASNVIYKLVAFNGNRHLGTSTSGNQICGIVACLSDDISSCGQRRTLEPMIGVEFNSINVTGNFVDAPAGHSLPSTLTFSLTPVKNYNYCRTSGVNGAQVNMNLLGSHDSIFAFGIFGRSFQSDGRSVGRSIANFNTICTVSVFFLTVLTILQQKIIS